MAVLKKAGPSNKTCCMRRLYTPAVLLWVLLHAFTLNAQESRDKNLLDLIRKNAAQLQLSPAEAEASFISSSYVDEKTGFRYVYLQQGYQGIRVFNAIKTILFRDNDVMYASGSFVYNLDKKVEGAAPAITAETAIQAAAQHLKLDAPAGLRATSDQVGAAKKMKFSPAGIAKQDIETELFWVPSADGSSVRLGWNVNIDVLGSADWWNVRVDAQNGNILEKDNWTVHEAKENEGKVNRKANGLQYAPAIAAPAGIAGKAALPPNVTGATYWVVPFPAESPLYGNHASEVNPWTKAGATNNAVTNGWHFDGTNNYTVTRGNNVYAYLDVNNNNTPSASANWPDTSSTAVPSLTFGNTALFTQEPSVTQNRKMAVTNLFYWNNIIHDVTYQYGFTEVTGNFQTDNMSRGGLGNDYVQAEAQDASGTNNANFSTPADGSRPRMQMYLFSAVPGVNVNAPASIAGKYPGLEGVYSTSNKLANTGPVTAGGVYYNDPGGSHEACDPPINNLNGKIAIIDRGNCNFTVKVKNAQDAGAVGVIMINNVAGDPIVMGGTDNSITIPSIMVTQNDGATILSQVNNGLNLTLSAGVGLDGDLDNGVITHEFTHGISNRLTGGPANASCLNNAEQGGEGWSDYVALMLTTKWSTANVNDGPKKRPMGNYVLGQSNTGGGIRTYPYSTSMTTNPLTYSNMATNTEVHFIGEIWCAVLWDMTWNIIQQVNTIEPNIYNSSSTAGNTIALRLVMEGMRLQPCRPGFLDARDAILAADSILYNGAYKCAIWKAFARRGMGFSAQQGLSSSATDQVAAFDVPSAVTLKKGTGPVSVTSGSQHTITLAATCQCTVPANNYTIRDTIPAGFSYVSNTGGGTVNGNVVSFSSVNFATTGETKTFTVTIKADAAGCAIDSAINDNREASTVGGLTAATLTGGGGWAASTSRSKSPSNSWWASSFPGSTDFTLTSSSFTAGSLSVLSFWHYYVQETKLDAGKVELSTDGGTNWFDAGPYMVQNGYNSAMAAASPIPGQTAFSGVSYGQTTGQFINTIVNLSPFAGQGVKVRLRVQTNSSNLGSYEGWYVDDILLMNGCGGVVKAGLYNASNVKIDSSAVPVFIRQSTTAPATIQSQPTSVGACAGTNATFTVTAGGAGTLTYQWQVSTNGGSSFTNITGATAASYTVTNVTAGMNGYIYRVVVDNGFGAVTSGNATLNLVTAPATPSTVNNATACTGQSAVFSVTNVTGLNYQWQVSTDGGTTWTNVSGATTSTLTIGSVANAQNNNRYRVVASSTCGSSNSNAAVLTVNSAQQVSINPLPASVCNSNNPVNLTASVAGGTWSGQGVSAAQFNPTNLAAGTYNITYTYNNPNSCVSTATASIVVNPNPTVSAESKQVCLENTVALNGQPAGGTWSGNGVTGGSFNAVGLAPGAYTVTYAYTASTGCSASATAVMTVTGCGSGMNSIDLRRDPSNGRDYLVFSTGMYAKLRMSVYGKDGKLISDAMIQNIQYGDKRLVSTNHLAAGIYLLMLTDDATGENRTFRFVVQR